MLLIRAAEVDVAEVVEVNEAGISVGEHMIDFTASDGSVDRFGEVIDPGGWRLKNYRKNPVFLNSHQNHDVNNTLGRAERIWVKDGKLHLRVKFAVNENPAARVAYDLYRGKYLRAVSVGFIPLRWEDGKPGTNYRRKYLEVELVEVSAVGVPANPNALMKANNEMGLEALRELAGMLGRGSSTQRA